MEQKIKKYQLWYKIFLTVGLFGLVDIVVGVLLKNVGTGFENGGGLTFMIVYAFKYLFGTKVAVALLPFIMIISTTWFIWLGVSAVLRRKIKKLEKEAGATNSSEPNKPVINN
ncbi:MAG: hypothetical protein PHR47_01865 [Candidatus Pacebacteria bacterium]|nr:hypothetical protein [Candidatus Paceibacterota bacterium]